MAAPGRGAPCPDHQDDFEAHAREVLKSEDPKLLSDLLALRADVQRFSARRESLRPEIPAGTPEIGICWTRPPSYSGRSGSRRYSGSRPIRKLISSIPASSSVKP